eukprot:CAMPEP_0179378082 /NCGR_PEP_ID=MMETSP0797-20121207/89152_1 /TAXON_ID=47934 /ORGANISM="Dinophysis acuminata, Strain DAEP01" /LENGTH=185 /DNA_ID=CAMNT_0021094143 /DNA_START=67 /DNA_END=624 /DNA_ORIENTATION=-
MARAKFGGRPAWCCHGCPPLRQGHPAVDSPPGVRGGPAAAAAARGKGQRRCVASNVLQRSCGRRGDTLRQPGLMWGITAGSALARRRPPCSREAGPLAAVDGRGLAWCWPGLRCYVILRLGICRPTVAIELAVCRRPRRREETPLDEGLVDCSVRTFFHSSFQWCGPTTAPARFHFTVHVYIRVA